MPIVYIIVLLVALQGFLLAATFLVVPYFRSKANRHLAYTFLAVGMTGVNHALISAGYQNPWLTLSNNIMWEQLFPATLLLYFVYGLRHPLSTQWQRWLLYVPFWITFWVNILIDLDIEFGVYHLNWVHNAAIVDTYYSIEDISTYLFAVATCAYSWYIVRNYPPRVPSRWFLQFWWLSTGVILFWILLWLVFTILHANLVGLVFVATMGFFSWVTYQGVLRFRLAEEKFEIRQILEEQVVTPPKGDIETTANPHLQRLEVLMQEQHLYRDPELSRDAIAQKLGISSGYLSQQMSKSGTRFSDYINTYRIEEVKQLLVDPAFQQYSLLAIGYEAGFNSKSTFYAAFKKATGVSPSTFREKALRES
ncbi:MAG: helix-turn-helix transcriptional regulator [Bacteroidota bacterium]